MKTFKLKLWLALSFIGLLGVASLLLSDLPLRSLPKTVTDVIPLETLKLLILINPALIVLITVGIGILVYDKVNFTVPVFEKLLNKPERIDFSASELLKWGVLCGILAGVLITGTAKIFGPYLPAELTDTSQEDNLNVLTKIMYGGVTEELMMRFGIMSLVAWLIYKITKKLNAFVYWTSMILASLLFALGHLPIMFQLVAEPTVATYAYIIIGNCAGGLVFGYTYWKNGLESAFIAHAFAHLTMIALSHVL